MTGRGIAVEDVEAVLANPSFKRPSYGDRVEWYGEIGGRAIKVIVSADTNPPVVVNAMRVQRRRLQRLIDRSRS